MYRLSRVVGCWSQATRARIGSRPSGDAMPNPRTVNTGDVRAPTVTGSMVTLGSANRGVMGRSFNHSAVCMFRPKVKMGGGVKCTKFRG